MRRAVARITVLLILGAIVNMAVAWGCALWCDQESIASETPVAVPSSWRSYLVALGWPPPTAAVERKTARMHGLIYGVTVLEISGGDPDATWKRDVPESDGAWMSIEVRQFGLPVRALQFEFHLVRAGPRSQAVAKEAAAAAGWRTGIDVSEVTGAIKQGRLRCLPLTCLWPGFLINTLFYAAILWLLFIAPGRVRRVLRRRRGLCPKCAYPIGESSVCTECGAAVNASSKP